MSETIEDIVCDMRSYDSGEIADIWVHRFAERIKNAHEREILVDRTLANEHIVCLQDTIEAKGAEIEKLRAENAQLKAVCDLWFSRADELRIRCDELYAKLKGEVAKLEERKLMATIDALMACCEYRTCGGTCGLLDQDDRTYTCSRANCPHIDDKAVRQ